MKEYSLGPGTGCTVGVVPTSDKMLFIKNRDLYREHLARKLITFHSTPDLYALRGINFKTEELEGVSIGVNKHRICVANTHVASTEGVTYDLLCEELLVQTRSKGDVPRIVSDFMERNKVQGGRILVSSPGWNVLVEVCEKVYRI